MIRHLTILTALFCIIISLPCDAMNNSALPNPIFKELTTGTKARQALYITKNRLAISNEQGCSIIDPTTDTLINQIDCVSYPHIALHQDKTKIALASPEAVTIYNPKTGIKEWSTKNNLRYASIASSMFNSFDSTIFIHYDKCAPITRHTYPNNTYCVFASNKHNLQCKSIIAVDPTQYKLCIALNPGGITIINQNGYNTEKTFPAIINNDYCEYSPNGSMIAHGNKNNIYISDLISGKQYSLKIQKNENVMYMQFHPNSSILVTLSNPGSIIKYWDTKTQECISSTPSLAIDFSNNNNNFTIEPKGKTIVIPLPHQCIAMPIPFEVRYPLDTKKKITLIYWLLDSYQNNILPRDVKRLITHALLKKLKR